MRDTEAEKSLFASEERSAVYQEGGGGGGVGEGREGKQSFKRICPFFFVLLFLFLFWNRSLPKMAVAQEHVSVGLHFMLFILWIVAGCGTARHGQDRCRCTDYLQPLSQFSRTANAACDPF